MTDSSSIAEQKARLRREAFERRDGLGLPERAAASSAIARRVLALAALTRLTPIAAYWPMRSEVDPRSIIELLVGMGRTVALPQTRHPDLVWRAWRPGDALVEGGFGVREPRSDGPPLVPAALLVPLCAFDRQGHRLGYGRGYYDRALAALSDGDPPLAIGLAFACQEVPRVPHAPHDRRLDLIVTEREVIRPETRT